MYLLQLNKRFMEKERKSSECHKNKHVLKKISFAKCFNWYPDTLEPNLKKAKDVALS